MEILDLHNMKEGKMGWHVIFYRSAAFERGRRHCDLSGRLQEAEGCHVSLDNSWQFSLPRHISVLSFSVQLSFPDEAEKTNTPQH